MRTAILMGLVAVSALSSAQDSNAYLKLRKQHKITQAASVAALETLVGSRTLEIKGVVKGMVTVGNGASLLLQRSDGDFIFVNAESKVDWLSGNEIPVRLLVHAERADEYAELKTDLLAAAPETAVASIERVARKPTASTSRSSSGPAGKEWNVAANEAVPIYASYIKRSNKRLSDRTAIEIAQGVIGHSIRYGVDARLIMAMLMVESGFNPNATSRAGAMGLGQLMPGTARGMGVSDAYNTNQNLYGTVRLIRGHLDKYKGRSDSNFEHLALALAAYNAGPGAVRKHGGVPPYRETQNYVAKVYALYRRLAGF